MTSEKDETHGPPVVQNRNSDSYKPGPVSDTSEGTNLKSAELSVVQAQRSDIQLEEFPDGPYGAVTDAPVEGKSTPWSPSQQSVSAFRDANPIDSNRKVALDEPPRDAPKNTLEAEN